MDLDPEFISVAAWASFAIHPLGHDVEIGFVDAEDHRFILKLHPNSLAAIFALTHPQMLDRALEPLNGNDGAKQVFGLDGLKIDAVNDGSVSVFTLCAADGFKVSFLADADAVGQLAQAPHQGAAKRGRKSQGYQNTKDHEYGGEQQSCRAANAIRKMGQ